MRNWYHFVWLCGDHICRAARPQPRRLQLGQGRSSRRGQRHGQLPCAATTAASARSTTTTSSSSPTRTARRCTASAASSRTPGSSVTPVRPRHQGRQGTARQRQRRLRAGARRPGQRHPQGREAQRRLARRHQQLHRRAGPHGDLLRPGSQVGRRRGQGARARCRRSSPSTPIRRPCPTRTATTRCRSPAVYKPYKVPNSGST